MKPAEAGCSRYRTRSESREFVSSVAVVVVNLGLKVVAVSCQKEVSSNLHNRSSRKLLQLQGAYVQLIKETLFSSYSLGSTSSRLQRSTEAESTQISLQIGVQP